MPAQEITYTAFNKIETLKHTISASNVRTLEWKYWPDFGRAKQVYKINNQVNTTKYYAFGNYEKEITPAATRELYYVNTPSGTVAVSVVQSGTSSLYYISTDALGSFDVITSAAGTFVERNSFDPWGRRRNYSDWTYNNISTSLFTGRGFTGHEHLLDFDLINMNGRIYDPVMALFLSPDNYLQAPGSCIGFDRYSYCFNNPLKYTDPSGNFAFWSFIAGNALMYTMQWLNNVLSLGMSPGEAFKNTTINLSYSGSFIYEDKIKSDYSAFYLYSSSSGAYSYYESYSAMIFLHNEALAHLYNELYTEDYNPFSDDFGDAHWAKERLRALVEAYIPPTPQPQPQVGTPWMNTALNEYKMNVKEVKLGSNSGPRVDEYLKYAGVSSPNKWCAAFVNWCLGQNNIKGAGAVGSAYLNWGTKLDVPKYGAIAIFKTYHVGFYMGENDDGTLKILHGNWSNRVTISSGVYDPIYPTQILEYRFPLNY